METPPSSPPFNPPELTTTMSLSPIQPTQHNNPHQEEVSIHQELKKRGHVRMATPSTPIPEEAYACPPLPPGASTAADHGVTYFTPGHSGHLMSDLTPVISNSNDRYVETTSSNQGARPGMPGLNMTSSIVVSPPTHGDTAMLGGGPQQHDHGRLLSSRAAFALRPLPSRAGLPPAKRSSIEGASLMTNPATSASTAAGPNTSGLMRMPSNGTNASSDSSLRGEHLRMAPSTPCSTGERLAMPNYNGLSMYSEDESSLEDTSNHDYISSNSGNNNNRGMFREIIGNSNGNPLAPIELKPDRKYFSFQGASQYQRAVGGGANNEAGVDSRQSRLETIPSPSRRPPASPAKEGHRLGTALPLSSSAAAAGMPPSERNQYQPMLRGQHGVTEICDTKDLDAIFKAPRANTMPNVVSPYTTAGAGVAMLMEGGPPMLVDHHQQPRPFLQSREQAAQDHDTDTTAALPTSNDHHHLNLPPAYPVESKWSIPSIRLANNVNNHSLLDSHGYSYTDFSEYTDDDGLSLDESYYSFLADDDDTASLSSKGSVEQSLRRRRISYHAFQRQASLEAMAAQANTHPPETINSQENALWLNSSFASQLPVIAQSNSFLEKISGISMEDTTPSAAVAANAATATNDANADTAPAIIVPPPLSRRANTFDSELPPPILNVDANNLNISGSTMDDADAVNRQSSRRRRNRNRSSRGTRRKEGAAAQWIQDLQNQSNDVQLITESASSKFMTGDNCDGTSGFGQGVGGVGQLNAEDVAKALGMPHPLCRSSTIEAGPFTVHRGVFGQSIGRRNEGGLGSGTNSIALTSSGSGD
eukprot:CAMPEP_0172315636 /NCGR_PEP_ID=MMETSP1058-20130122/25820_1 /TAXON_ID=83371 /ORGANISM="Detonula confervacea, Strain CCMP 353" /LENGTH=816 /DNA_ID=CAMNT_0013029755 /DNA_START=225 /DNA_END=2675 /DNA_ORIENTATION=-